MTDRNDSSGVRDALRHGGSPEPRAKNQKPKQHSHQGDLMSFSPETPGRNDQATPDTSTNHTTERDTHTLSEKRDAPVGSDGREGNGDHHHRGRSRRDSGEKEHMDWGQKSQSGRQGQDREPDQGYPGVEPYDKDSCHRHGGAEGYGKDSSHRPGGAEGYAKDSCHRPGGAEGYGKDSSHRPGEAEGYGKNSYHRTGGAEGYGQDRYQGLGGAEGHGRNRQVEKVEDWRIHLERASSCCQLEEMRRLMSTPLGPLKFSSSHTILIEVDTFNSQGKIVPQKGRDLWHKSFVRLPCSKLSMVNVKTTLKTAQKCRWEVLCKPLKELVKKKSVSVDDVKDAIVKYNPKYKDQWTFDALQHFVRCSRREDFYAKLFPKIADLAMQLPQVLTKGIPLLQRGHAASITLSQHQIACLLANAFFCTFPHRNTSLPASEYHNYPTINFNSLFGNKSARKNEKLQAILCYFDVVTESMPNGLVTFERRVLKDAPRWESSEEKMSKLYVSSSGSIEKEGHGMLEVDFAASMVGGGVLGNGMLQEEILFLVNPELIVSRLFTERLADDECLLITGCQQFSSYTGYADGFQWVNGHIETTKSDDWCRLQRQIVAMDALNFKNKADQYTMNNIKRELNKAYCSFKGRGRGDPDIATGKWGCGAFNGDPQLKAVIQLMAAAKAQRGVAFFTFGDDELKRDLELIYHLMVTEKATVGKLYRLLSDYCAIVDRSRQLPVSLFDFLSKNLRGPGDKFHSAL